MGRHRILADWGYKYKMLGASVAGPSHVQEGSQNQDAFQMMKGNGYIIAVVCDGMGSASKGREGAEAAVQSVLEAMKIWIAAKVQNTERLLKLIHQIWNIKVDQWGGRESATTCLFAILKDDGSGYLARLGDGLILAKTSGTGTIRLAEDKQGFANETRALGTVTDLKHWEIKQFEGFQKGDSIMLCSDGISEDIEPGKELGFMQHLKETYGNRWIWCAQRSLTRDLNNWPTDKHSDDKTICLVWK